MDRGALSQVCRLLRGLVSRVSSPPILLIYLGYGQPPTQEGAHRGNNPDPLFSVCSKVVDKDTNAIAERLRKGRNLANFIMGVSHQVSFYAIACINRKSIAKCVICGQHYAPLRAIGDPARISPIYSMRCRYGAHHLSTIATTLHLDRPFLLEFECCRYYLCNIDPSVVMCVSQT